MKWKVRLRHCSSSARVSKQAPQARLLSGLGMETEHVNAAGWDLLRGPAKTERMGCGASKLRRFSHKWLYPRSAGPRDLAKGYVSTTGLPRLCSTKQ